MSSEGEGKEADFPRILVTSCFRRGMTAKSFQDLIVWQKAHRVLNLQAHWDPQIEEGQQASGGIYPGN